MENNKKKSIIPTEQGILTTEKLKVYFNSIINVEYTANMEADLDKIATGNRDKLTELNEFYNGFLPIFNNALENMEAKYPIPTDEICPICNSPLVIRLGKYGEFVACSNYPECKYIKKEETDVIDTNICCPSCHKGNLLGRVAVRGMNKGKLFYSCSNYPKCKNIYNDKPIDEYCPKCNSIMLINEDGVKYCSNHCDEKHFIELKCPKCGHTELNKHGKTYGRQRYICKKCRRTFDERSLSPLSNTKLSLEKWLKYCQFMIEGGTIRMCAEEVGVSVPTAFFMRHKILDVINVSLKDEHYKVVYDPTYFTI